MTLYNIDLGTLGCFKMMDREALWEICDDLFRDVRREAFTATNINKIFSVYQPCQSVKSTDVSGGRLCTHDQRSNVSRCPDCRHF
jgi:hypothetical protein